LAFYAGRSQDGVYTDWVNTSSANMFINKIHKYPKTMYYTDTKNVENNKSNAY